MASMVIRRGTVEDAPVVVEFIRRMLEEMALVGGYRVSESPQAWSTMLALVQTNCSLPEEYLYLLACEETATHAALALVAANIEQAFLVFAPRSRLHFSAIYTLPAFRRQGIASQLMRSALAWGRERNTAEADLNVLTGNPARRLYEQLGFTPHEISMVVSLSVELTAKNVKSLKQNEE